MTQVKTGALLEGRAGQEKRDQSLFTFEGRAIGFPDRLDVG